MQRQNLTRVEYLSQPSVSCCARHIWLWHRQRLWLAQHRHIDIVAYLQLHISQCPLSSLILPTTHSTVHTVRDSSHLSQYVLASTIGIDECEG